MLILAPSSKALREVNSISKIIAARIAAFRRAALCVEAMAISRWRSLDLDAIPTCPDWKGDQEAADADNYRTTLARICNATSTTTANGRSIALAQRLCSTRTISVQGERISTHQPTPIMPASWGHLRFSPPGAKEHRERNIRRLSCLDLFRDLVSLDNHVIKTMLMVRFFVVCGGEES